MIVFPQTVAEAQAAAGTYRAGGTELQERRKLPGFADDLVDLRDVSGRGDASDSGPKSDLNALAVHASGELRIGAKVSVATVGAHPHVRANYPGFSQAAAELATPQIRAVATVAGNLLQRNRCWYFRAPNVREGCFKRGGSRCAAREGDHLYLACFDRGPCVSVHPSTLGAALLAYDGKVELASGAQLGAAALFGDGSDPTRDNMLPERELVTALILPAPASGERSAYARASSRSRSEWPLVEVLARVVLAGETVSSAAIALGGIAPVPLRATQAESALVGARFDEASIARAAAQASAGSSPLPMTAYKVELIARTVAHVLELAAQTTAVAEQRTNSKLPTTNKVPGEQPEE